MKVKYPELTVFCPAWNKDVYFKTCDNCKEKYVKDSVVECKLEV